MYKAILIPWKRWSKWWLLKLSSECPKLCILGWCILVLLWASILFSENNLGKHQVYWVHDSLPDKLKFYTGKTILSFKEHWQVQLVICLSSVKYEIQGHLNFLFFRVKYSAHYLQSKPNLNIQKSFPVAFSKKGRLLFGCNLCLNRHIVSPKVYSWTETESPDFKYYVIKKSCCSF